MQSTEFINLHYL